MSKTRVSDDERVEDTSVDDGISYVSEDYADALLDKHMNRWATLLERLK